MASPTIILITDRADLDIQLSDTFTNTKTFIGGDVVQSVTSRAELCEKIQRERRRFPDKDS